MSRFDVIKVRDPETGEAVFRSYKGLAFDDVCPLSMANDVPSLCHNHCKACPMEIENSLSELTGELSDLAEIRDELAGIHAELKEIGR